MKKPTRPKSIGEAEAPGKFKFKDKHVFIHSATNKLTIVDSDKPFPDECKLFALYGMSSSTMKQLLELEKHDFIIASGYLIHVTIPKDEDTIKREQAEYEEKIKEYNRKLTQYKIDKLKYDEYMLEKRKEKLLKKALLSNS